MAAYIPVPRDLTRVKSKVFFNLTKRQLVCFGAAALIGVPSFFLLKRTGNVSARHFIQSKFTRPKVRPYQTNNYYVALKRQHQLEKEVNAIVFQEETAGKKRKNARKSHKNTAEAD